MKKQSVSGTQMNSDVTSLLIDARDMIGMSLSMSLVTALVLANELYRQCGASHALAGAFQRLHDVSPTVIWPNTTREEVLDALNKAILEE